MLHKSFLPRQQQGQVMVEYAIILILSITLLIGGIEMAATAFASSKASDGAKAGANEFAEENEKRLTAQRNQVTYLRKLDVLYSQTRVNLSGEFNATGVYENYVDYLDDQDGNLIVNIDDYQIKDYQLMLNQLALTATGLDADANGTVTEKEVKDYYPASSPLKIPENLNVKKIQALILLEQLKLSQFKLNPDIGLSKSTPLIGDHDGSLMTNPSCGAATYNTGLPDNDADGVPDTEWPDGSGGYYPAVYLFNPKPIDVASCAGVDALRGGRSKLSILVGGFGKEGEANYFKGLPKLNQAMYGQYVNVCLDGANQYVSCSSGAVAQTLLKPPGKLCLSNAASPTVDSCTVDAPAASTTGYYFWGSDNDTPDEFSYTNDQLWFRPTFQVVCNPGVEIEDSHQRPEIITQACTSGVEITSVQINTRYRSVFESFLTFGLQELQDANLAQYFYDPSNLRSLGTNLGVGIAGSELGPKRQNGNPTVKPFKDFRGCYEVNVETNQVSACN